MTPLASNFMPLLNRVVTLDRVRGHVTAYIFLFLATVIDRFMSRKFTTQFAILTALLGVQAALAKHVFADDRSNICYRKAIDMEATDRVRRDHAAS